MPAPDPAQAQPQPQNGQTFSSGPAARSVPPPNIGGATTGALGVTTTGAVSDEQAIIAQQAILIATQAQAVRDYEAVLNLAPPPPTTPPVPPGPGVSLTNVIATQLAAIRTQAAYLANLQDLVTALGVPGP